MCQAETNAPGFGATETRRQTIHDRTGCPTAVESYVLAYFDVAELEPWRTKLQVWCEKRKWKISISSHSHTRQYRCLIQMPGDVRGDPLFELRPSPVFVQCPLTVDQAHSVWADMRPSNGTTLVLDQCPHPSPCGSRPCLVGRPPQLEKRAGVSTITGEEGTEEREKE